MDQQAQTNPFGALSGVLARDLADIEDLPVFVSPPPGVYKLIIEFCGQREINEKTAVVVEYIIGECIGLSDPTDEADVTKLGTIKPGDKMSEAFYFNDADRIETVTSVLKGKYGGLSAALGTTNLLEILTQMKGMQIQAQVTNRVDKQDKSKIYASTKNIIPAV